MSDAKLHERLAETATNHVLSTSPKLPGGNQINEERILSLLSPSAQLTMGHAHFISTAPHMQGSHGPHQFVGRVQAMSSWFETWRSEITDVNVDVSKLSAVVRTDFYMTPKGFDAVRNEIIFWVVMDEAGDKVVRCTEFVDPTALAEIAARVKEYSSRSKDVAV